MIPTELFLILALIALLAGGLIGWDMAIHRHRASHRALARLEKDMETFRQAETTDPQRAWIDAGKRNVIGTMEATLRKIRATLEHDS
jgi:hypothetical protein